jgi:hypothetical protein
MSGQTTIDPEEFQRTAGPAHTDHGSAAERTRVLAAAANTPHTHGDEATVAADDKELRNQLPELSADELKRLAVLEPRATLEQGAIYVDLNDGTRRPFKALGGETAGTGQRLVSKRETDYELWNRLVRSDRDSETEPAIDRPEREPHAVENQGRLND